ncbi:glycosyltransferase [Bacteroidota bacterium]
MLVAEYIMFSIIVVYSITIISFTVGWLKLKTFKYLDSKIDLSVSIVIAFRNEEENITDLLNSLLNQTYPEDKFEIILVDDHSIDNTSLVIKDFIKNNSNIKLFSLPGNAAGKKNAVEFGIKNSTSNLLITTDADCIMNKNWLISLIHYYSQFKPKLLVGPVAITSTVGVFEKFQALEFLSLVGSGAGVIGINHAIMCNGANLLFEKSLFLESNQNKKYASGDDVFLMIHSKRNFKNSIHFIKSADAVVYTSAEESLKNFINQRIRWTSKSKACRDFDIVFTALLVTFTNLIIVLGLIYTVWDFTFLNLYLTFFVIKFVIDLTILIPITRFFKKQRLLWYFLPLQIIYPFYITFTAIFGLIGNFRWKDRNFKEKR